MSGAAPASTAAPAAPAAGGPRRSASPGSAASAALLTAAVILLAGFAAGPVYATDFVWATVAGGGATAFIVTWAGMRWRWGVFTPIALFGAFALLVVPLAVPTASLAEPGAVLRGLVDGLASVALGWKQLLTLTLPVGTYQAVLVPLLVTVFAAAALAAWLALRGGRAAPFAALGVVAPALFGTVFGSSEVSEPLVLPPAEIVAPRELALWLAAFAVAATWVAWSSGSSRRRALRLGRVAGSAGSAEAARRLRRNRAARAGAAALLAIVALGAGTVLAPAVTADERRVPRDRVDPELIVREQTSALAAYRTWKRDAAFAAPIFSVSGSELPHRLRLAVLDRYDGVDFSVGDVRDTGRFVRFPTGERVDDAAEVEVAVEEGYSGIWVPLAPPLAAPPSFTGERAADLADGFYLNRETGGAIAVPGESTGLRPGDAFTAPMSTAADARVDASPAHADPQVDLEAMPQLERWLRAQALPATGAGLEEAVQRLRDRGYLSHSLTDGEGEREWSLALAEEYGTRFITSPGGHSVARVETLFEQLAEQQLAAGEGASRELLVAGIGDDEQFAAAAALVARAMGFDSRVVVGVRLDEGVPGVPACDAACTGEHVAAWVEVRGAEGGWAPLDVTPQVETPPRTLTEGERYPEFPTLPDERDASVSDPPIGASDAQTGETEPEAEAGSALLLAALRVAGLSLAALCFLALPFLFIPAVKRLRRRRRRSAQSPEVRALGAWDEWVDRTVDAGAVNAVGAGTRRDTARRLGLPSEIAGVADRAVYARESVTAAEADRLWEFVDQDLAERARARSRWGRVRAAYSLASFGVPRLRRVLAGRRERRVERGSA